MNWKQSKLLVIAKQNRKVKIILVTEKNKANILIQYSEHVMNKINSENTPFKTTRGSQ